MTARFITFEGGEGAGKSTHVKRLAASLAAPADASLKAHTSKRNPKVNEKPGDGEEGE